MKGKQLTVQEVRGLKDGDRVYVEKHNVPHDDYYDSYNIKEDEIYTIKGGEFTLENSNRGDTCFYTHGMAVRNGKVKVFKYEEEKKMLDVREMKNYSKGKEISIEDAKRLPVGTLLWVENDFLTEMDILGEVRVISDSDPRLKGCEIIQSKGDTGCNGYFTAPNLKIYEWTEDVQMDTVQIIREVPKPVDVPPIREIRFKTCFGKDVVIETKSGCSFGLSMSDGSREMYGAIEREDMRKVVQALTEMLNEK